MYSCRKIVVKSANSEFITEAIVGGLFSFLFVLLLVQVLMDIFRFCSSTRWRHLMSKSLQAPVQHTIFQKSYNLHGASYQMDADTGGSGIVPGTPRLPCLVLFHPKQVVPHDQIWMHSLKCLKICILQLITSYIIKILEVLSVVCITFPSLANVHHLLIIRF